MTVTVRVRSNMTTQQMIDARFVGGPWSKQVRSVPEGGGPEGGGRIPVGDGVYRCARPQYRGDARIGVIYEWFAPALAKPDPTGTLTVDAPSPSALRGLAQLARGYHERSDERAAVAWIQRALGRDLTFARRTCAAELARSVVRAMSPPHAPWHSVEIDYPRQVDARFAGGPWAGQVRSVPFVDTLIVEGHERRSDGKYRKLGTTYRREDHRVVGAVFCWEEP